MLAKLNGYKTYIIAGVSIVALWAQVWNKTLDPQTAIDGTLAALGLGALRHGISKGA